MDRIPQCVFHEVITNIPKQIYTSPDITSRRQFFTTRENLDTIMQYDHGSGRALSLCKCLIEEWRPKFVDDLDLLFDMAIENGCLDVCQYLVMKCNFSVKCEHALFQAADNGHVPIMQFLRIHCQLRISDLCKLGGLALNLAAKNGHLEMCRYILDWRDNGLPFRQKGMTIQDLRSNRFEALRQAAQNGHLDICQLFRTWQCFASGATIKLADIQDTDDCSHELGLTLSPHTLLQHAIMGGNLDVVKLVASWDSDTLITISDIRLHNNMAFRLAATYGHVHICQWLQEFCDTTGLWVYNKLCVADLHANDNEALRRAAENGHVSVLKFLKDFRYPDVYVERQQLTLADIGASHDYALRRAVMNGHVEVCQLLKDWSQELAMANNVPLYPLWESMFESTIDDVPAVVRGQRALEIFQFLSHWWSQIRPSVDRNSVPWWRSRILDAFEVAIKFGHIDICQHLAMSWHLTTQELIMCRALLRAVNSGNLDMCKWLKDWRDPNANKDAQRFLLDRLTIQDIRADNGAPLVSAATQENIHILKFLRDWVDVYLDRKCRLTLQDVCANDGWVLQRATHVGNVAALQFFKEWEDEPEFRRYIHETPYSPRRTLPGVLLLSDIQNARLLQTAARHGHVKVLQLLKEWRFVSPNNANGNNQTDRLTVSDLRAHGNLALESAAAFGRTDVLQFLKNWTDRSDNDSCLVGSDRLTIQDVRANNNMPLRYAADYGHFEACQFLRQWSDANGSRLTFIEYFWATTGRKLYYLFLYGSSWQAITARMSVHAISGFVTGYAVCAIIKSFI